MKITVEWLKNRQACESQIAVFAEEWPKGVTVTRNSLLRAASLNLDVEWLAGQILKPPARKAYDEATAPAWKAYGKATASAWKAYGEATASAWKAYGEAIASAQKAYDEAIASALWKAVKNQERR